MFIFMLISSTVIDIKINIVPSDTKTSLMTGDVIVDAVSTQDWGYLIVWPDPPAFGAQQVWLLEVVGDVDSHLLLQNIQFSVIDLPQSR